MKTAKKVNLADLDEEDALGLLETPFHTMKPNLAIGSYESAKNPRGFMENDDDKLVVVRVTHQVPKGVYEIPEYPTTWMDHPSCPQIKWSKWTRNKVIMDMGQGLTDSQDASQKLFERIVVIVPALYRHIQDGSKILIHCTNGESRSVTVAIALMMSLSGLDGRNYTIDSILNYIKSIRPQAAPVEGHLAQLRANQQKLYNLLKQPTPAVSSQSPKIQSNSPVAQSHLESKEKPVPVCGTCHNCEEQNGLLTYNGHVGKDGTNRPICTKCGSEAVTVAENKSHVVSTVIRQPQSVTGKCFVCRQEKIDLIFEGHVGKDGKKRPVCSCCKSEFVEIVD